MPQENLNVSTPNSGLGDALRAAFVKVQNMFTELYGGKVDKVTGKELSANDFTNVLKDKIDGIASFAEVNVQANWTQADITQDDFIKNKPSIPVLGDYLLNGGYLGNAQDLKNLIDANKETTIWVLATDSPTITDAALIGKQVQLVLIGGIGSGRIITTGTPTGNQLKFDSAAGTLERSYNFADGEEITIKYL